MDERRLSPLISTRMDYQVLSSIMSKMVTVMVSKEGVYAVEGDEE